MASENLVNNLWEIVQSNNNEEISYNDFENDLNRAIKLPRDDFDRAILLMINQAEINPNLIGEYRSGTFMISSKFVNTVENTIRYENQFIPGKEEFNQRMMINGVVQNANVDAIILITPDLLDKMIDNFNDLPPSDRKKVLDETAVDDYDRRRKIGKKTGERAKKLAETEKDPEAKEILEAVEEASKAADAAYDILQHGSDQQIKEYVLANIGDFDVTIDSKLPDTDKGTGNDEPSKKDRKIKNIRLAVGYIDKKGKRAEGTVEFRFDFANNQINAYGLNISNDGLPMKLNELLTTHTTGDPKMYKMLGSEIQAALQEISTDILDINEMCRRIIAAQINGDLDEIKQLIEGYPQILEYLSENGNRFGGIQSRTEHESRDFYRDVAQKVVAGKIVVDIEARKAAGREFIKMNSSFTRSGFEQGISGGEKVVSTLGAQEMGISEEPSKKISSENHLKLPQEVWESIKKFSQDIKKEYSFEEIQEVFQYYNSSIQEARTQLDTGDLLDENDLSDFLNGKVEEKGDLSTREKALYEKFFSESFDGKLFEILYTQGDDFLEAFKGEIERVPDQKISYMMKNHGVILNVDKEFYKDYIGQSNTDYYKMTENKIKNSPDKEFRGKQISTSRDGKLAKLIQQSRIKAAQTRMAPKLAEPSEQDDIRPNTIVGKIGKEENRDNKNGKIIEQKTEQLEENDTTVDLREESDSPKATFFSPQKATKSKLFKGLRFGIVKKAQEAIKQLFTRDREETEQGLGENE